MKEKAPSVSGPEGKTGRTMDQVFTNTRFYWCPLTGVRTREAAHVQVDPHTGTQERDSCTCVYTLMVAAHQRSVTKKAHSLTCRRQLLLSRSIPRPSPDAQRMTSAHLTPQCHAPGDTWRGVNCRGMRPFPPRPTAHVLAHELFYRHALECQSWPPLPPAGWSAITALWKMSTPYINPFDDANHFHSPPPTHTSQ